MIFLDQRIAGEFAGNGIEAIGEHAIAKEERAIGAAQPMHLGARRAAAPQADDVESDQRGGLPERKAERNDVVATPPTCRPSWRLRRCERIDEPRRGRRESVVADADMTADHGVVGERHLVADMAIVPDMGRRP